MYYSQCNQMFKSCNYFLRFNVNDLRFEEEKGILKNSICHISRIDNYLLSSFVNYKTINKILKYISYRRRPFKNFIQIISSTFSNKKNMGHKVDKLKMMKE